MIFRQARFPGAKILVVSLERLMPLRWPLA